MSQNFAVDGNGRPLLVHRGEHGKHDGHFHSRLPSLTFSSEAAATQYALHPNDRSDAWEEPRIVSAYLDIRKPLLNDPRDGYLDLSLVVAEIGHDEAIRLALLFKPTIEGTSNWQDHLADTFASVESMVVAASERVGELYFPAWMALDDPEFIAKAKSAGFDGAIHRGNGATWDDTEYRVFDHAQANFVSSRPLFDHALGAFAP